MKGIITVPIDKYDNSLVVKCQGRKEKIAIVKFSLTMDCLRFSSSAIQQDIEN